MLTIKKKKKKPCYYAGLATVYAIPASKNLTYTLHITATTINIATSLLDRTSYIINSVASDYII